MSLFKAMRILWFKLQLYCQNNVAHRVLQKLAKRYFGTFKIIKIVGFVAYHMDLPSSSRIHLVIHVSLLKPYHGGAPERDLTPIPTPDCIHYEEQGVLPTQTATQQEVSKSPREAVHAPNKKKKFLTFEGEEKFSYLSKWVSEGSLKTEKDKKLKVHVRSIQVENGNLKLCKSLNVGVSRDLEDPKWPKQSFDFTLPFSNVSFDTPTATLIPTCM
ncbi:unnamed protein product [Vicia faba]|uniref:Tf2-1-like SH3-like domain-containing protein n=1 Tax=Vicia faba TaxID=3906 RepID=A0AAV0Z6S0_VICFA|nr:unnamed protein product [Vicia faba]